jgi:hypothetical protein
MRHEYRRRKEHSRLKTSKAFSTISYNTEGFLKATLDRLVNTRKLAFYAFIEHYPEEDEKKMHKHVYLVPNGQVDTDQVREELLEVDLTDPLHPLACMPCKSSKFADWYLYGIHDKAYLASKGQTRQYHYRLTDVQAFDQDALEECVREIDLTSLTAVKRMLDAQQAGITFAQFFRTGGVPVNAVKAFQEAWNLLYSTGTYRNGRAEPTEATEAPPEGVDPVTGEFTEAPQENPVEAPQEGYNWQLVTDDDDLPY